jgi:hypothetical protein
MTNDKMTESHAIHLVITQNMLARLGDGRVAYVRAIRSEDVANLFPQAPKIAPGIKLFSLHSANGTPIMLTKVRLTSAILTALCKKWMRSIKKTKDWSIQSVSWHIRSINP